MPKMPSDAHGSSHGKVRGPFRGFGCRDRRRPSCRRMASNQHPSGCFRVVRRSWLAWQAQGSINIADCKPRGVSKVFFEFDSMPNSDGYIVTAETSARNRWQARGKCRAWRPLSPVGTANGRVGAWPSNGQPMEMDALSELSVKPASGNRDWWMNFCTAMQPRRFRC